jgi:hypothetical protein
MSVFAGIDWLGYHRQLCVVSDTSDRALEGPVSSDPSHVVPHTRNRAVSSLPCSQASESALPESHIPPAVEPAS